VTTVSDFERILVPTDFGDSSDRAVDIAVELAEKLDASVTLLHTYEIPTYAYAGLAFAPDDYLSAVADAAKRDLEAVLAKVRARMPRVKAMLRQGEPRAEILAAIHETRADLVVMGTHGRHGLARAFLGSVAEATVRSSRIPVLTTRSAPGGAYA
jgi:nucleotide-binding universal stress UspA family protein